jgi:ABC-type uncharacterized transport system involved in gliding motility auxiliary subunit
VLVLAGPKTDLLEQEVPLIEGYLEKSGKLLALLDPPADLKTGGKQPRLDGLLAKWGIKATNTIVVDLSGRTNDPFSPAAAPPYPQHAITRDFSLVTAFPLARAVVPDTAAGEGRTAQPFLQTAQRSWAESDMKQVQNPDTLKPEEKNGDLLGPVTIGVAVAVPNKAPQPEVKDTAAKDQNQPPPPETRVAAIGDADFPSNAYQGIPGNLDLFMNTIGWLAQQENLISIRPREAADRRLTLTASQITGVAWLSIVLIPAAVLGTGAYTWWRRR